MESSSGNRAPWRMFDGSVSVSVSMSLAALIKVWDGAADQPVIGLLHEMTRWDDGVIIVATLLLFPTSITLYGVFAMIFAAKEAVEKRARNRGRLEGIEEGRTKGIEEGRTKGIEEGRTKGIEEGRTKGHQEGRQAERERISKVLAELGMALTPEQARAVAGEHDED